MRGPFLIVISICICLIALRDAQSCDDAKCVDLCEINEYDSCIAPCVATNKCINVLGENFNCSDFDQNEYGCDSKNPDYQSTCSYDNVNNLCTEVTTCVQQTNPTDCFNYLPCYPNSSCQGASNSTCGNNNQANCTTNSCSWQPQVCYGSDYSDEECWPVPENCMSPCDELYIDYEHCQTFGCDVSIQCYAESQPVCSSFSNKEDCEKSDDGWASVCSFNDASVCTQTVMCQDLTDPDECYSYLNCNYQTVCGDPNNCVSKSENATCLASDNCIWQTYVCLQNQDWEDDLKPDNSTCDDAKCVDLCEINEYDSCIAPCVATNKCINVLGENFNCSDFDQNEYGCDSKNPDYQSTCSYDNVNNLCTEVTTCVQQTNPTDCFNYLPCYPNSSCQGASNSTCGNNNQANCTTNSCSWQPQVCYGSDYSDEECWPVPENCMSPCDELYIDYEHCQTFGCDVSIQCFGEYNCSIYDGQADKCVFVEDQEWKTVCQYNKTTEKCSQIVNCSDQTDPDVCQGYAPCQSSVLCQDPKRCSNETTQLTCYAKDCDWQQSVCMNDNLKNLNNSKKLSNQKNNLVENDTDYGEILVKILFFQIRVSQYPFCFA